MRVYEDRMDLLRAVIVGAYGTPYQDGLFFFDFHLPPEYPQVPPVSIAGCLFLILEFYIKFTLHLILGLVLNMLDLGSVVQIVFALGSDSISILFKNSPDRLHYTFNGWPRTGEL